MGCDAIYTHAVVMEKGDTMKITMTIAVTIITIVTTTTTTTTI
jgi:hypothetical protein